MAPTDKTPLERAELLATTPLFADIHAESADSGQSAQTGLHFTCFVEAPDADIRDAAQGAEISESAKSDTKTSGYETHRARWASRRTPVAVVLMPVEYSQDVANLVKARYMSASTSVYFNLMALSTAPQHN
ncbi:hypothetical protein CVT25_000588 [Psilocybe cyanescens]|uniref:UCH catalytic domain-containing protein n=1 Tax=Psilocybe cyanescens TaxID=93625 RepID=A0A409XLV9_PSICY|nr:hypothetical protein CVT25_000588 [Psilocybe cyanescens]